VDGGRHLGSEKAKIVMKQGSGTDQSQGVYLGYGMWGFGLNGKY
jgi:hypothetical protein